MQCHYKKPQQDAEVSLVFRCFDRTMSHHTQAALGGDRFEQPAAGRAARLSVLPIGFGAIYRVPTTLAADRVEQCRQETDIPTERTQRWPTNLTQKCCRRQPPPVPCGIQAARAGGSGPMQRARPARCTVAARGSLLVTPGEVASTVRARCAGPATRTQGGSTGVRTQAAAEAGERVTLAGTHHADRVGRGNRGACRGRALAGLAELGLGDPAGEAAVCIAGRHYSGFVEATDWCSSWAGACGSGRGLPSWGSAIRRGGAGSRCRAAHRRFETGV
mgnify:CR=1 FL=1